MNYCSPPLPTPGVALCVRVVGIALAFLSVVVHFGVLAIAGHAWLLHIEYGLASAFVGILTIIVFNLSHRWTVAISVAVCLLITILWILTGCPWTIVFNSTLIIVSISIFVIIFIGPITDRLLIRYMLMGFIAVGATYILSLFIYIGRDAKMSSFDMTFHTPLLWLLLIHSVILCFAAWALARLTASNDPWLFASVVQTDGLEDPASIVHKPYQSEPKWASVYLLEALIRPPRVISRIRDRIEPKAGSCSVRSEIEYAVPACLCGRAHEPLFLPVVFQGKCELSHELNARMADGSAIRRLSDDELVNRTVDGFEKLFEVNGWKRGNRRALQRLVEYAFSYRPDESSGGFNRMCGELCRGCAISAEEQAVLVVSFLAATRYVKPICYMVSPPLADGNSDQHMTLVVDRNTPLVPVRELPDSTIGKLRVLRRLFSKRRSHFYYGLGNADCAQSYHLSFSGPKDSYLSEAQLVNIGGPEELFVCERIRINARFDQNGSRLFIRKGRGFSRAALSLTLEHRSQRSIATMVLCTLALLLTTLYFYFGLDNGSSSLSDAIVPLTILSASVLSSIWQGMENYQAEEWMWLCSGADAIASAFVSIKVLFGDKIENLLGPWIPIAWYVVLVVELSVLLTSGLVLLFKVKLHGMLMDRVPRFRQVPGFDRTSYYRDDIASMLAAWSKPYAKKENDITRNKNNSYSSFASGNDVSRVIRFSRDERYRLDIISYNSLMSTNWVDGWMIPAWSAGVNPFRQPSVVYTEFVYGILKKLSES